MKLKILFFFNLFFVSFLFSQKRDILDKLDKKDSLTQIKASVLDKNVVTREIHNAIFRNIYSTNSARDEEAEFKNEINKYLPYENKVIDTIIYFHINAFGENVYDTSAHGSSLEIFLSEKIHSSTKTRVIKNRFMLLKSGDVFSPYRAFENARLIRSSGLFHDVRIQPVLSGSDKVSILVYVQDVFPYGFDFSFSSFSNFSFGIENRNILGLGHKLNTEFRLNQNDIAQPFGFGMKYTIPNIIQKTFIDAYAQVRYFSNQKGIELGAYREFSRPEFRWAGGNISSYNQKTVAKLGGTIVSSTEISNQVWGSYSIPFRSRTMTVNAIIVGAKYSTSLFTERPVVTSNSNFDYWNRNFFLFSGGYSRVKFIQDRILNGFGRTEDVPIGFSINGLYGIDLNQFGSRNYYGGQFLAQYFTKQGYYINLGLKGGFYTRPGSHQGVYDFNLQNASPAYKLGNFRLRNYVNIRATLGINRDSTDFITLNEYNGIRGVNNGLFQGNSRFTASYQANLFLPFTFLGFRYSYRFDLRS